MMTALRALSRAFIDSGEVGLEYAEECIYWQLEKFNLLLGLYYCLARLNGEAILGHFVGDP